MIVFIYFVFGVYTTQNAWTARYFKEKFLEDSFASSGISTFW